jgi:hypothetical protein
MSFNEYKSRKEQHRQSNFRPVATKKSKREEQSKNVTINVGMMTFHEDQNCLRPVWGKNQTVTVARNSTCAAIFEQAITKRKAHDRHFAKLYEKKEYQLLLPDGSSALFLPGSDKQEFFNLELIVHTTELRFIYVQYLIKNKKKLILIGTQVTKRRLLTQSSLRKSHLMISLSQR